MATPARLHPFFSYFGSKFKIAKNYQSPTFKTIIEPFAGSAGYSLMYPDRQILLYEKYEPIVQLWKYLINVTEADIMLLPLGPFTKENPISDEKISDEAKILIGFWATESQTSSSRYPLSKSRGGNWTERKREMIASQLQYIRHWKVEHKSYELLDNPEATWYIDPPYQEAGKRYREKSIDYKFLADWCKARNGQVIVCEQRGADWLPFQSLTQVNNASNKKYEEVVWYDQSMSNVGLTTD